MFPVHYLDDIFWCGYVTFTFLLLVNQSVFILLNTATKGTSPTLPAFAINSFSEKSDKTAVSLLMLSPEHPTASSLTVLSLPQAAIRPLQ